jgi:murein DD-endopeptidase MepM/ murein hydrolase activator NlpD
MRKKVILLFVFAIPIVALLSRLLWPVMWTTIAWEYVCAAVSYSYVDSAGAHPGNSSTDYDCRWVQYSVTVDYTSGGGIDVQPPEPDPRTAGGDSGSTGGNSRNVTNTYDRDNDGVIDCWKNVLIRCNDICISQYFNDTDDCHQGVDFYACNQAYGVDIAGEPVYSATNGTVYNMAENANGGYGWWIEIKADDGSIWKYCHLEEDPRKIVASSQRVTAGKTVIGKADHTGTCRGEHEGAHLHLECRVDGLPIDPLGRIEAACL